MGQQYKKVAYCGSRVKLLFLEVYCLDFANFHTVLLSCFTLSVTRPSSTPSSTIQAHPTFLRPADDTTLQCYHKSNSMRSISSQATPTLHSHKDHLNLPTTNQQEQDNTSGLDISPFQSNQAEREGNYQWSDQQNRKYYEFLLRYKQSHLQLNSSGKVKKINVQMSAYIQTRTSAQCRSHHQKMIKRFGHLDAIITYFQGYFSRKSGQALCWKATSSILLKQPVQKMLIMRQDHAQQSTLPWPVTAWDLRYSPALISVEDDPPSLKK